MNKIYRVVWNAESGQWVVASEMAKGRKKKASRSVLAASVVVGATSLLGSTGAMAVNYDNASGSLQLCQGPSGSSYGSQPGANSSLNCATAGETFSLNSAGDPDGAYGFAASNVRVTGYANNTLELKATNGIDVNASEMRMHNAKITGLGDGLLAANSKDAVNGGQLFTVDQKATAAQTAITNINNGAGIKYFHANGTLADSSATGAEAVAVGPNAQSAGKWAVAMGTNSNASADNSVALGNSSVADRANAVSVGNSGAQRQIIQVAKGTADTDAVNVSQLKGVTTALGGGTTVNGDGSVKAPSYTINGNTYNNVGDALTAAAASNGGADALNWNATTGAYDAKHGAAATSKITNVADGLVAANSKDAVNGGQLFTVDQKATAAQTAITNINNGAGIKYFHANSTTADSQASGSQSVAIGGGAKSVGTGTIAIGEGAQTTYNDNMAVGAEANAGGGAAIAIGNRASTAAIAGANYQTALGVEAKSEVNMGTALGGRSDAKAVGSVALGSDAVADRASGIGGSTKGAVSIGSGGAGVATDTRQIISVARGTQDTDAVNLSQLKGVTTALGGGTAVNADGSIKAPAYDVNGTNYNNVGGAIDALDGRIDGIASNPLKFSGNSGSDVSRKLGETFAIKGAATTAGTFSGGNIKTVTDPTNGGISIQMADAPKFGNIVVNDGGKISGLADGTAASDAATKGQMDAAVAGAGKWKLTANSGTAKTITSSDTVNLVDGKNTKASFDATTNQLKVDVVDAPTFSGMVTANGGLTVGAGKVVDMGGNKVTNVAAGTAATDAVNFGQLKASEQSVTTALGGGSTVNADGTITKPTYSVDGKSTSGVDGAIAALDTGVKAAKDGINGLDGKITDLSNKGLVFAGNSGTDVSRKLGETFAIKGAATTAGTFSGGNIKTVTDPTNGGISIQMADAPKFGNIVVNDGGKISGLADGTAATDAVNKKQLDDAVIKAGAGWKIKANSGAEDVIAGGDTVAVVDGKNTKASYDATTNQLKVDVVDAPTFSGMVTANGGLTVGAGKVVDMGGNKITKVAAGTADTDAVNVSQLKGTAQSVADALGGGSTVDPTTGKISEPTYSVDGKNATGVDGAIAALDTGVKAAKDGINGLNAEMADVVKYDAPNHKKVTFGDAGTPVVLANVADGNVASGSKEAVNGGQLYDVQNTLINKGLVFSGNSGADVSRKLGETFAIKGQATTAGTFSGGNIKTVTDPTNGGISIQMADAPKFGNIVINDGGNINMGGGKVTNLGDATAATDGVNKGQMDKAISEATGGVLGGPLTIAGNVGSVTRKLGDTVTIKGGNGVSGTYSAGNIMTEAAADGSVTIKMADAPKFGDITINDGGKISGVTAGTEAGDVATFGQLTDASKSVADVIGGGATVDPATGKVTEPTFTITDKDGKDKDTHTVADAFSTLDGRVDGIDGRVTIVEGNVTNIMNGGGIKYFHTNSTLADSQAKGVDSVAIGGNAIANANNSVALGSNSTADRANTVSVRAAGSERQIVNVKAGVEQTDAVNVSQLKGIADAIGGGISIDPATGAVTPPKFDVTDKDGNVVPAGTVADAISTLDGHVTNIDARVTNIIDGKAGLVQYDDASGTVTVAKDKAGTKVDFTNVDGTARQLNGVAAGGADTDAVNIKQLKDSLGGGSTYDSNGNYVGPTYIVHNIDGTTTTVNNVGDAVTNLDGRVTNLYQNIDNGTVGLVQQAAKGDKLTVGKDTDGTEVNFTGTAGDRKLTGVADGAVDATSHDAVNGSQLHAVSQSVADAMGGGSTVNPDGSISAPTYNVTNIDGTSTTVNNVGDAITNLDGRTTQNTQDIQNITNQINEKGVGLVTQDATSREIKVAKDTDGKTVNIAGTEGDRTIAGVAAGKADNEAVNVKQLKDAGVIDNSGNAKSVVTYDGADKTSITLGGAGSSAPVAIHNVADGVADHDAINVNQLNQRLTANNTEVLNQANSYTDKMVNDVWQDLGDQINHVNQQANRGIAAASALVNVTPYLPGHTAVNAGVASYRGEAALGVGVSRWSDNGRVNLNAGVSASKGDQPVFRVGIGYVF